MKKINYFFVALMTAAVLGGCGKKDEGSSNNNSEYDPDDYAYVPQNISGGTEDERLAIVESTNMQLCTKNGSSEICPEDNFEFSGTSNDYLKMTTSQNVFVNDESYTVKIEWNLDETKGTKSVSDANHILFEFNYPKRGEADTTFNWSIKSMTCGDASTTDPQVNFSVKLLANTIERGEYTIAEINKVTEGPTTIEGKTYPSTFDLIDYEHTYEGKISPDFPINGTDGTYERCYVRVLGEVIYYAPDGNWALIADGDQILEFYAGSGTPLIPKNFPAMEIGNKVAIEGHMASYYGNFQLGFITKISKLDDTEAAKVTSWTRNYPTLTETAIAGFKVVGFDAEKQAIDGFMNSLRSVTGTLVAGSLKNNSKQAVDVSGLKSNDRFTFELQVGAQKILVAYDKHCDLNATEGLFNGLKAALSKGSEITIKGTMRYSGAEEKVKIQTLPDSRWSIVPFLAEHVA